MRKSLKKYQRLMMVSISVFILVILANRWAFGVWNPLSLPDRIECYGRRYYISSLGPETMSEAETPKYAIGLWDLLGKPLYMSEPKGSLVPVIIYLKLANGQYQVYTLSGSN
jgi:hypothetical protein